MKIISFKKRKKAREYTLQILFCITTDNKDIENTKLYLLNNKNLKKIDMQYLKKLTNEIIKNIDEIDLKIQNVINNTLHTISPVELTIIRIGTYELIYCKEIPHKVIINESLNLAKKFGSSKSHKFINAIIDKIKKKIINERRK